MMYGVQQPDWASLAGEDDLYNRLVDWLREPMEGKYGTPEEDQILARLAPPLKMVWVLNWLDFEVTMGGFDAYFANGQRPHADAAITSLRAIGATRLATIVERATGVFDANEVAWEERNEEINKLEEYAVVRPYEGLPGVDELGQLTTEYYSEENRQNWRGLLNRYLRGVVKELAGNG